ncbi:UNVERIFIED_CONTAM: hypothetical protein NCL1_48396 [Trichonephila clavipes]
MEQLEQLQAHHLRFDVFEPQETKLPVRLINERYSRAWGYETTSLRVQGDIEDVSSELDNEG